MTPRDLGIHIGATKAFMELLEGAINGIKDVKIGPMETIIIHAAMDALMEGMEVATKQLELELTRKVHEANPDHVVGDTKDLN